MGTIAEKLGYLKDAVGDIQQAINDMGVVVDSSVPLEDYGMKIREIASGGAASWFGDYRTLEAAETVITEDDIVAVDVEDISDTISITENSYAEL